MFCSFAHHSVPEFQMCPQVWKGWGPLWAANERLWICQRERGKVSRKMGKYFIFGSNTNTARWLELKNILIGRITLIIDLPAWNGESPTLGPLSQYWSANWFTSKRRPTSASPATWQCHFQCTPLSIPLLVAREYSATLVSYHVIIGMLHYLRETAYQWLVNTPDGNSESQSNAVSKVCVIWF